MAADLLAAQLVLRTRLRTLAVATTGSTTLAATTTGYSRASGSFVADGFAPGMEVTPAGFTETSVCTIAAVSALALTISGGRTAEASGAGRTLTVGLPTLVAYENVALTPVAGRPYVEEEFVPATRRARTFPASDASMEDTGLYVTRVYVPENTGVMAARRYADAIATLFKAGTALVVATGVGLRVRSDVAPIPSAVRFVPGWAVVTVSIPWRLEYANT